MPEGPEIRREAYKVGALKGRDVRLKMVNKLLSWTKYATARTQIGALPEVVHVNRVLVHGKEVFLEISLPSPLSPSSRSSLAQREEGEEREKEERQYIRLHMGMGGAFYTLDHSDPPQRHSKGLRYKHVLLEIIPVSPLPGCRGEKEEKKPPCGWGFADIRGFGKLEVMSKEAFQEHLAGKGPDVMASSFTEEALRTAVGASPKAIADLLPDQTVLSGIGNGMRSEILWEARINPKKAANSLTVAEFHRLFLAIQHVMEEAYSRGERYKYRVYQRLTDREGNLTRNTETGQKVWWSPKRQPEE